MEEGISIPMPIACLKIIRKSKVKRAIKNSARFLSFTARAFCHWWQHVRKANRCCWGSMLPADHAGVCVCPGKPDHYVSTPSTPIYLFSPVSFLQAPRCKWDAAERVTLSVNHVEGTERKEKSKGQAAGHVDTKSQWNQSTGVLPFSSHPVSPQVLSKAASLVPATRQSLHKSHLAANSLSSALHQPWMLHQCQNHGGSSRRWHSRHEPWQHCTAHPRVMPELLEHVLTRASE